MTSVCLVGKDCIAKEGLKGVLARADFELSADYEDVSGLCGTEIKSAANLIINIDTESGDGLVDAVRRQKDSYPQSRVVVLSSCKDIPVIAAAFSTGVDGYILKDISTDGLMGSLRLVASGEKVFPPAMLAMFSRDGGPVTEEPANAPLSEREIGILRHLAAGNSNKAIALSLNLREATVKTHVKKILRKLGAANRTQAAVWAIAHGFQDNPPKAQQN